MRDDRTTPGGRESFAERVPPCGESSPAKNSRPLCAGVSPAQVLLLLAAEIVVMLEIALPILGSAREEARRAELMKVPHGWATTSYQSGARPIAPASGGWKRKVDVSIAEADDA